MTDNTITISEDKLRTMFAEFKLELFTELQKYATASALTAAEAHFDAGLSEVQRRITVLELWRAERNGVHGQNRRISAGAVAWAAVAVAAIGVLIAFLVFNRGAASAIVVYLLELWQ